MRAHYCRRAFSVGRREVVCRGATGGRREYEQENYTVICEENDEREKREKNRTNATITDSTVYTRIRHSRRKNKTKNKVNAYNTVPVDTS